MRLTPRLDVADQPRYRVWRSRLRAVAATGDRSDLLNAFLFRQFPSGIGEMVWVDAAGKERMRPIRLLGLNL